MRAGGGLDDFKIGRGAFKKKCVFNAERIELFGESVDMSVVHGETVGVEECADSLGAFGARGEEGRVERRVKPECVDCLLSSGLGLFRLKL